MFAYKLFPLLLLGFLILCGAAFGQDYDPGFRPDSTLFIPHAAIDATTGDLLVISNTWRNTRFNLRRFDSEGTADADFKLQRFESCCAIRPALVAVDKDSNIYTLEFAGSLNGYYIYKHNSAGELDLDWGQPDGTVETLNPIGSEGGYDAGVTTLTGTASGGRMHHYFTDPVELITRPDGTLLVLDRVQRYVYLVSADGTSVSEFIGRQGYYPIRPQRLLLDSDGYIYLVDYYDTYDINRANMPGVFKFNPDGSWIFGWGEGSGINDPWRPGIDLTTLVLDGSGNLIAISSDSAGSNHSEVVAFDHNTGAQISRDNIQYRMGFDSQYLGILGRHDGGFIIFESWGFEIVVNYYTVDGVRERQTRITELYQAE